MSAWVEWLFGWGPSGVVLKKNNRFYVDFAHRRTRVVQAKRRTRVVAQRRITRVVVTRAALLQ